jgi:hypothetical protein
VPENKKGRPEAALPNVLATNAYLVTVIVSLSVVTPWTRFDV